MKFLSKVILLSFITLLLATSCKTKKELVEMPTVDFREELLDTIEFSSLDNPQVATSSVFRASATRRYDILHTKLDIRFDWDKQHVLGKAELTIKPFFQPIKTMILDAQNFDIHSIKLKNPSQTLQYTYDGNKITITLDRSYIRTEEFIVQIDYTAKPEEGETSGSAAITSNKGLFFINPQGKTKGKPTQIWTQGETENNSRWFPTFDKPNERCTQEIYLTVEDKYLTLSNGKLISSTKNQDGTRTDYWKQNLPHAPYLFMVAVGEFHEETEMWNNIPLNYIVEKGFKRDAKKIFNHTPEMLSFFSDKLNYPYPWDKYSQIVVRDFVSGAMENTGAVVFGEFVQKTERELIDNDNDYIVAHELFHHWFGNLVTCEDWSNLTLNEGFANYSEYLWYEHKYGKDRAEYHRMTEMNGYFSQVYSQGARPLVHYYYGDKEQMFDAHSYNKGGLILHMLRNYVGDEAFFVALNKYLTDNAFSAVEVAELRMAFEDTIGEDLNWFFDQWFLKSGHPTFNVTYTYDDTNRTVLIDVNQTQDSTLYPSAFIMPLSIATYYEDGNSEFHNFHMTERNQSFLITDLKSKPATIVFDGRNDILGLINENKSEEQYDAQYRLSPNFTDKIIALSNIEDKAHLMPKLLEEDFFIFRAIGLESIPEEKVAEHALEIQNIVLFDKHSQVRATALETLLAQEDIEVVSLLKRVVGSDQAYPVVGLALEALAVYDIDEALKYAEFNINDQSEYLSQSLLGVFATSGDVKYLPYFHKKLNTISVYQLFDFFDKYQLLILGKDINTVKTTSEVLFTIGTDEYEDTFKRFFATATIDKMRDDIRSRPTTTELSTLLADLDKKIITIKASEKDELLKLRYEDLK